jgi:hypothetical protein
MRTVLREEAGSMTNHPDDSHLVAAMDGRALSVSINPTLELIILVTSDDGSFEFSPDTAFRLADKLTAAARAVRGGVAE